MGHCGLLGPLGLAADDGVVDLAGVGLTILLLIVALVLVPIFWPL
jgi:hypothetical protein